MPTTTAASTAASRTSAVDIADPGTYEHGIPHEEFARLRREDPVHRHPYVEGDFWAVTRYPDVVTVTRDWQTYSSAAGMVNLWDLSEEAKQARRSIIETDPPAHARLRKLAMGPFTARRVLDYQAATRAIVTELLDQLEGAGDVDLVQTLSAPLPIRVLVGILGVPQEDVDYMVELSDHLVEGTSGRPLRPDAYGNTTALDLLPFNSPAAHALFEYGRRLGEQRRGCPASDLVSSLVHAEIDGDRLSDVEYANFFQVLVFAGNETTRTAISHGLHAFMQYPDQLALLHERPELVETAVEEVVRWATPVLHFRRTATRDTVLGGTRIQAGDRVVVWYASSNFDETVFDDPLRFDITRAVRPKHLAFGAQGPHQCLGASLARLELRLLLEEIARRRLVVEQAGPIGRVRSNFVHGVSSLPGRVSRSG
jgi:cholest-4-en-3-one 26-monooxygenase